MYLFSLILTSFVLSRVWGTLTPSGSVSIGCGGQQTFTCTVTGLAGWTITGLMGISSQTGSTPTIIAASARVTTPDPALGPTSTITITGFNTSDNEGTVQCEDIRTTSTIEGVATITVGVPSCPTNARVTDRSSDFSSANITWDQPTNSPPVTSYDVTCNSSCTAMPCSSRSSTCRVLSVSPCEDYSVTVLPMNSCGSSTGCTGNSVVVPSQGPPQCGQVAVEYGNDSCPSFTFTPQGNVLPSTVVVSYQLVGDPSSAGSLNCSYPIDPQMCELVVPGGTYTVRATPQNSCGSPSSACTTSFTESIMPNCTRPTSPSPPAPGCPLCWLLLLLLLLLIPVIYSICVALVWHFCYKDYNYCQVYWCCCFCKPREGDGKIRTSSTEPMKASPPPPPAPVAAAAPLGEYADPKDVRKRKEENKIQYADLEFTKRSGGGQGTIHQKEEPVTYTAIQHA